MFRVRSPAGSAEAVGWARRAPNDALATVPIAARAPHVAQGDANRSLGVPWLHAQVQINHGPATVARDHKPWVLCGYRSGDFRPEPDVAFARKPRIEAAHGRQCIALGFPCTAHSGDVVVDFVIARVVAHAPITPASPRV